MTILHIKLFGGFHVRDVAAAADVKVTPNLQHLLAYLLLFRHRAYARDVLMELFWGDHDEAHARACLNTAPVSYTHLDVYKRQSGKRRYQAPKMCSSRRPPGPAASGVASFTSTWLSSRGAALPSDGARGAPPTGS